MLAQHLSLTKKSVNTKNRQFSIERFGAKNTISDHQNVVDVVNDDEDLNGNICSSFKL